MAPNNSPERGMHGTWLVSDPDAFFENPGPTSPNDRVVPFSLTYTEWYNLFFLVLRADEKKLAENRGSDHGVRIIEFEEEISGYPMLSRIRGPYYDAEYAADEVHLLEAECLRLLPTVSNAHARSGLEKLLNIAAEAKKSGLNIFMMCP